jgi:RNA 2',3'-cyclic 3'-phosphodiesterase
MFVAVWPDESTRQQLANLEFGPTTGLRLVPPQHWHVTLSFLGEVDESAVPRLRQGLGAAAHAVPGPLPCRLGPRLAWFGAGRVLQIPAAGLDLLAASVRAATAGVVPEVKAPFNGHLTLARPKKAPLPRREQEALASIPFEAEWMVDGFDLVSSEPTRQGHRYTTLSRHQAGP